MRLSWLRPSNDVLITAHRAVRSLRMGKFFGLSLLIATVLPHGSLSLLNLGSSQAEASVAERLSLDDMTAASDLIVRGIVEQRRTIFDRGQIDTLVTLRVTELHKGEAPDGRVVVRVRGGERGARIDRVDGQPTFTKGEDVFVFLQRSADEQVVWHRVISMAQGKFSIVRDSLSGEAWLKRDLSGISFATVGFDGKLTVTEPDSAAQKPAPYGEIIQTVRRQILIGQAFSSPLKRSAIRKIELAPAVKLMPPSRKLVGGGR